MGKPQRPHAEPDTKTLADYIERTPVRDEVLFDVLLNKVSPDLAEALIIRQFAYMGAIKYHTMIMQGRDADSTHPPRPDTVHRTARQLEQYFDGEAV